MWHNNALESIKPPICHFLAHRLVGRLAGGCKKICRNAFCFKERANVRWIIADFYVMRIPMKVSLEKSLL